MRLVGRVEIGTVHTGSGLRWRHGCGSFPLRKVRPGPQAQSASARIDCSHNIQRWKGRGEKEPARDKATIFYFLLKGPKHRLLIHSKLTLGSSKAKTAWTGVTEESEEWELLEKDMGSDCEDFCTWTYFDSIP